VAGAVAVKIFAFTEHLVAQRVALSDGAHVERATVDVSLLCAVAEVVPIGSNAVKLELVYLAAVNRAIADVGEV